LRILIVSDAWYPQVNGVVRALDTTARHARLLGHEVDVIGPDRFRSVPLPSYPEIRIALRPKAKLARMITAFAPDALHIATEGPLGWAARDWALKNDVAFTSSFHTQFPEYVWLRTRIPLAWTYGIIRRFHTRASRVMVTTETLRGALARHGVHNTVIWPRGVDTELFRPYPKDAAGLDLPRPILAYVGRVAVEKNLEAFLSLKTPGTKLVVGDGPSRTALERKYPGVVFVGAKQGEDLARHYACADCFVFPSKTDTFGMVMLESLACGVPVAAFPVQGPNEAVGGTGVGVLDDDLTKAIDQALAIPADKCRAYAETLSWTKATEVFVHHLQPADIPADPEPAPAVAE